MCNFVLNMDVDLLIFAAPLAIPTLSLCRSRLDCCTKHAGPVQPPQATAHCPYSMTSCSLKRGKTNSNSVLVFFLAETCRKLLSLLQFRTQYSTPFIERNYEHKTSYESDRELFIKHNHILNHLLYILKIQEIMIVMNHTKFVCTS